MDFNSGYLAHRWNTTPLPGKYLQLDHDPLFQAPVSADQIN